MFCIKLVKLVSLYVATDINLADLFLFIYYADKARWVTLYQSLSLSPTWLFVSHLSSPTFPTTTTGVVFVEKVGGERWDTNNQYINK